MVGKWVDGKTLYETTYTITGMSGKTRKETTVSELSSFNVVYIQGVAITDTYVRPVPCAYRDQNSTGSAVTESFTLYYRKGQNIIVAVNSSTTDYGTVYATIRYTKS